jgi:pyrroline-5-carboxylate reductase
MNNTSLARSSAHGIARRSASGPDQRFSDEYVNRLHALINANFFFPLAPGGCTIAGLLALEDGKVRSTIARCIQIATERASKLGQSSESSRK